MNKIMLAVQVARFALFAFYAVKELVLQAEEQMPEKGRGAEKFNRVKEALRIGAAYAGIAEAAVNAADNYINDKINAVVAAEINPNRT